MSAVAGYRPPVARRLSIPFRIAVLEFEGPRGRFPLDGPGDALNVVGGGLGIAHAFILIRRIALLEVGDRTRRELLKAAFCGKRRIHRERPPGRDQVARPDSKS